MIVLSLAYSHYVSYGYAPLMTDCTTAGYKPVFCHALAKQLTIGHNSVLQNNPIQQTLWCHYEIVERFVGSPQGL